MLYYVDMVGSDFFNFVFVFCRHNWLWRIFQSHVCLMSTQLVMVKFFNLVFVLCRHDWYYTLAYNVKVHVQNFCYFYVCIKVEIFIHAFMRKVQEY